MSIEGSPRTIFIWTLLITVFCVVTTIITFSGVLQRLGSLAACPGAQEVVFEDSSGASVDPVGHQGPISTQVTKLHCTFENGTEKTVGNDQVFLYGLLVSTGIGVFVGSVLATFFMIRNRTTANSR
jgi:hypothetical protein